MKRLLRLSLTLSALALCVGAHSAKPTSSAQYFKKLAAGRVESSQDIEWRNLGPGMSGYNETMIIHPADDNVMFLGPDMRVTYGSWDKGESWQSIKDYDSRGRSLEWLLDIDFSRQDPNYGVAISYDRGLCEFYETKDMGRSWEWVSSPGRVHREMVIDPKDDRVIYLGAGDFWNVKDNHRTAAKIGGVISKRADYGHVLKSTDRGRTWTKLATDISPELSVGRMIISEKDSKQVIMATSHGVFVTKNGGKTWSSSANGLLHNQPRDMTSHYDPKSGKQTLWLVEQTTYEPSGKSVVSKGGVFRSEDFGATWVDVTGDLGLDLTKNKDLFSKTMFYKTVGSWLGINQQQASKLYPELPTQAMPTWNRIAVNPVNPEEIYLVLNKKHDISFGSGDVWKSNNGGKSWFPVARSGKYWFEKRDADYWATKGVKSSMNMTFSHVHTEMERDMERQGCRHLNINSKGELYVGVAQQTLFSDNGGESWMQIDDIELKAGSNQWIGRGDSNLPGRYMVMDTGVKGRKLFCSGEHGLFQSVPLGDYPDKAVAAFEQLEGQKNHKAATSISTVAVNPKDPNMIYMLMWRQYHRGTLRRSTDGGKTWENISTIHEAKNPFSQGLSTTQASLMIDPVNPNNIYFCSIRKTIQEVGGSPRKSELTKGDYGVYRSTDGGYTWALSNRGLPANCSVHRLTMDPQNPQRIYASLNQINDKDLTAGLYVSEDGAKSFKRVRGVPQEVTSVNDLFITNEGDMLISCGRQGGELTGGGVYRSKDGGKSWRQIFDVPCVWHVETSPLNSKLMAVTVPYFSRRVGKQYEEFPNPGVYLSKDGGDSWMKINKGLGQSGKVVEVKFDPDIENELWCASWGCGWYKTTIK
ncbi:MAG: hypothetical protein SNG14_04330 [Rikenellaceae bacterium]